VSELRCPHCGHEVAAGQRFCGSCGGVLALVCPACQTENPLTNNFCGSCGAELARPQVIKDVEERKVVTVLFADIVGFTSRAERLDPEDVRELLSQYFARLRSDLEAYGGTVEKFIGDAVMAVFGAPIAHGDDPERAVRAALAIRQGIRDLADEDPELDLRVRIGINTGEAIVTLGPETPLGEGMVAGDVVNTASRLQTAAPENGILVGEETYRATNGRITYEQTEPLTVKGKAAPVRAWLAVAAASFGRERPKMAPLIGRDHQLLVLRNIWEEAVMDCRPRLVTLLGPPGIGKSRLAAELAAEIESGGGRALHGRALPYGASGTYLPFRQQVKELAGIFENDPPDVAHEKLEQAVSKLLDSEDAEEVAEHLALLIGLRAESDVEDRQVLFFSARRFLEAVASDKPTLLLYDDIQWADPSLLDLVEHLAARVRDVPLVLLALARPELLDGRPSWGSRLPAYSSIPLEPLEDEDSRELATQLLTGLGEDAARLAETAGGNPLFIEELAASLTEGATISTSELPTSVRAIVSARLDALPPTERSLVLDASVMGRVFWRRVLEHLGWESAELSAALDSLEHRDLIRRDPKSRVGGDQQFSFKHALIRDVAYATLPRGKRRARHAAFARFVEEDAGELEAVASFLAHHWREAGDSERALDYYLTAAERASRGWAKEEAVEFYDRALELVPQDRTERRRRIMLARAVVAQAAIHTIDAERLRRADSS
jgi:class 3 adenylate cyclase/tetratricopeptide (TPR) repeat protein